MRLLVCTSTLADAHPFFAYMCSHYSHASSHFSPIFLTQLSLILFFSFQWRLNNKASRVRQQACDLIARIAVVMKRCKEDKLLNHLGLVLYENLGEEYPEVLGSILGAIKGECPLCVCVCSDIIVRYYRRACTVLPSWLFSPRMFENMNGVCAVWMTRRVYSSLCIVLVLFPV